MEDVSSYAIGLIRYLLTDDAPEMPDNMDFERLYSFGASHSVDNMLFAALDRLGVVLPGDIQKKFRISYKKQVMVEATQALEFEQVSQAFEQEGIDFLPLKGCVVKYLYPMPDYRKSGDIDILVKPADADRAGEILESFGYVLDKSDEFELHKGYRKPPCVLVEVHDRLVEQDNRAYEYFSGIWNYVTPKSGTKHCYEMDSENFYAFTIAHLCKHIKNGGAGIKFITDIWILLQKGGFSETRLDEILHKARVADFEKMARNLALSWFGGEELTTDGRILTDFIIKSGSFGNRNNIVNIRSSTAADDGKKRFLFRIKRIFGNVFPPYRAVRKHYPIIEKYKVLYPFACIAGVFSKIFVEKLSIRGMISRTVSIDNNSVELKNLWHAVN